MCPTPTPLNKIPWIPEARWNREIPPACNTSCTLSPTLQKLLAACASDGHHRTVCASGRKNLGLLELWFGKAASPSLRTSWREGPGTWNRKLDFWDLLLLRSSKPDSPALLLPLHLSVWAPVSQSPVVPHLELRDCYLGSPPTCPSQNWRTQGRTRSLPKPELALASSHQLEGPIFQPKTNSLTHKHPKAQTFLPYPSRNDTEFSFNITVLKFAFITKCIDSHFALIYVTLL